MASSRPLVPHVLCHSLLHQVLALLHLFVEKVNRMQELSRVEWRNCLCDPNARLKQTLSLIMFDVLLWRTIPKYSPCMAKAETSIAHTFEQCWLRPTDNKPWSHPISAMIQDCGTKLAIVLSLPTRKFDIIFGFNDALDQIDYPCSMIQSLSRTNPLQLCTQAKRWHTWSVDRPRVLLFYDHKYSIEEASSVKKTVKSCPLQWCRMKH